MKVQIYSVAVKGMVGMRLDSDPQKEQGSKHSWEMYVMCLHLLPSPVDYNKELRANITAISVFQPVVSIIVYPEYVIFSLLPG